MADEKRPPRYKITIYGGIDVQDRFEDVLPDSPMIAVAAQPPARRNYSWDRPLDEDQLTLISSRAFKIGASFLCRNTEEYPKAF